MYEDFPSDLKKTEDAMKVLGLRILAKRWK